jgi:hypothetical protein
VRLIGIKNQSIAGMAGSDDLLMSHKGAYDSLMNQRIVTAAIALFFE